MSRARNIKPGFFRNEELAECTYPARLLFIGLWTLADREGRLEDRPKRIRAELLAFDSIEVEPLLEELVAHAFIERYQVGPLRIIQVLTFTKHQSPHFREPPSTLPPKQSPGLAGDSIPARPEAPPALQVHPMGLEPEAGTGPSADESASNGGQAALIPDSGFRIPDTGLLHLPVKGTGAAVVPPPAPTSAPPAPSAAKAAPARGTRLPEDWTLPKAWGEWAQQAYPHWDADTVRLIAAKFGNHWKAATGKGATKLDWLATWQNWCHSGITQKEHPLPRQNVATRSDEPEWARERRERNEAFLGPFSARAARERRARGERCPWDPPGGDTIDVAAFEVDPLGLPEPEDRGDD